MYFMWYICIHNILIYYHNLSIYHTIYIKPAYHINLHEHRKTDLLGYPLTPGTSEVLAKEIAWKAEWVTAQRVHHTCQHMASPAVCTCIHYPDLDYTLLNVTIYIDVGMIYYIYVYIYIGFLYCHLIVADYTGVCPVQAPLVTLYLNSAPPRLSAQDARHRLDGRSPPTIERWTKNTKEFKEWQKLPKECAHDVDIKIIKMI
jgi:hypothetical protein